jgi:hypothetical protein
MGIIKLKPPLGSFFYKLGISSSSNSLTSNPLRWVRLTAKEECPIVFCISLNAMKVFFY